MNVFYFSSDMFVGVMATSIISLLENNKSFPEINIYIADDGIKKENKIKLEKMISGYNRNVFFIETPSPTELFDFPFKDRYQIGHSYPRMAIDSLLPEHVDRILCLDSDTLVLNDLSELWGIDFGNNIMAGVADCMNLSAYKKQFKLKENEFYCNAGMFLVDLKKWRTLELGNKIKRCIKQNNGNIFFFEQTLMNYICRGKIIKLHPKYNTYTLFYAFKYDNLIKWRKPTVFYSDKEVMEAVEKPSIVHFTRNFYMLSRPWVKGCDHPLAYTYISYKEQTPWKKRDNDQRSSFEKIKFKVWHCIPQKLLAISANVIYNKIRPRMWWKNE